MIQVEFTLEGIDALEYERYHHPDPRVQKRMEILYLKSQGTPHNQIKELCHISGATLATYLKLYRDGGIEALKQFNYKGSRSKLEAHTSMLENWFREHPPRTSAEAQKEIERLTGIRRSQTQIREFMKRIGMKIHRTRAIPRKSSNGN
uniref:Homeodomain-like domain-containing protein n=1 Tax=Candidatus Kentrum sp. FM TaxID=2126340 RepID=A0A450S1E1_9GAMM|nr:MAG: Homeodomain-like domain-containing protein [Candidatus Kentron sp. FM]VFJ49062.1 MAG: Homeodomain-like domain-containing protein [Candidatus Kentron sp. FM]VFK06764.1 MAG: Homeodomain-like domain-containing protein [Candidatus Kentron sp. FM]